MGNLRSWSWKWAPCEYACWGQAPFSRPEAFQHRRICCSRSVLGLFVHIFCASSSTSRSPRIISRKRMPRNHMSDEKKYLLSSLAGRIKGVITLLITCRGPPRRVLVVFFCPKNQLGASKEGWMKLYYAEVWLEVLKIDQSWGSRILRVAK